MVYCAGMRQQIEPTAEERAIISRLALDRGEYVKIARATGIKYTTLTKLACGQTKRPYGRTLKALQAYYAARGE